MAKIQYFQSASMPTDKVIAGKLVWTEGRWYWRLLANNGRILADGAEGYSKRSNVIRACDKFRQILADQDTTITEVKS